MTVATPAMIIRSKARKVFRIVLEIDAPVIADKHDVATLIRTRMKDARIVEVKEK